MRVGGFAPCPLEDGYKLGLSLGRTPCHTAWRAACPRDALAGLRLCSLRPPLSSLPSFHLLLHEALGPLCLLSQIARMRVQVVFGYTNLQKHSSQLARTPRVWFHLCILCEWRRLAQVYGLNFEKKHTNNQPAVLLLLSRTMATLLQLVQRQRCATQLHLARDEVHASPLSRRLY